MAHGRAEIAALALDRAFPDRKDQHLALFQVDRLADGLRPGLLLQQQKLAAREIRLAPVE